MPRFICTKSSTGGSSNSSSTNFDLFLELESELKLPLKAPWISWGNGQRTVAENGQLLAFELASSVGNILTLQFPAEFLACSSACFFSLSLVVDRLFIAQQQQCGVGGCRGVCVYTTPGCTNLLW